MQVDIIGVPMDYGAGRRGVDMGPSAIRYAGLKEEIVQSGHLVNDWGNLDVPVYESCDFCDPNLRFLDVILSVTSELSQRVERSLLAGRFPLCLGGDHSLALGSVRGAARTRPLGLIWVDAHADFNTAETTPSGNIHGMPLAALAGLGDPRLVGTGAAVQPEHIAIVGVRDLDPGERMNLKQAGVAVFSMDQIDSEGLHTVFRKAIEQVSRETEGIYLSFDLDAVDPLYASGVGTPVQGGLTFREAHLACEMIAETGLLVGMDLVEVNPILDERNKTAPMAVNLAVSALGKRIW